MSLANCVQSGSENKSNLDFQGDFRTCPSPEIVPNSTLDGDSGALGCDAATTDKWSPAFPKDWHLKPLNVYEGATLLRNAVNHLLSDAGSQPRRPKSSIIQL
jgi:hypothetical protein